jgi:hypothetical protein
LVTLLIEQDSAGGVVQVLLLGILLFVVPRSSGGQADVRAERWAMDSAFNTNFDVIIGTCQAAGFDPVVNGKC